MLQVHLTVELILKLMKQNTIESATTITSEKIIRKIHSRIKSEKFFRSSNQHIERFILPSNQHIPATIKTAEHINHQNCGAHQPSNQYISAIIKSAEHIDHQTINFIIDLTILFSIITLKMNIINDKIGAMINWTMCLLINSSK